MASKGQSPVSILKLCLLEGREGVEENGFFHVFFKHKSTHTYKHIDIQCHSRGPDVDFEAVEGVIPSRYLWRLYDRRTSEGGKINAWMNEWMGGWMNE